MLVAEDGRCPGSTHWGREIFGFLKTDTRLHRTLLLRLHRGGRNRLHDFRNNLGTRTGAIRLLIGPTLPPGIFGRNSRIARADRGIFGRGRAPLSHLTAGCLLANRNRRAIINTDVKTSFKDSCLGVRNRKKSAHYYSPTRLTTQANGRG